MSAPAKPRPVILDTDIGTDIDDTWALAMLLASPELDLRLITTVSGDVRYRGDLCAGLLAVAGRRDVPIGLGAGGALKLPPALQGRPQTGFGEGALSSHPTVFESGVDAMIDAIIASDQPVTIIGIGPLTNIAEALKRRPEIAQNATFVGMYGSVRVGYRGVETPSAEYNVFADIPAAQAALSADWNMTITPLDSCGSCVLKDGGYQRFYEHARLHPGSMARAVLENYRLWLAAVKAPAERLTQRSTTQYDAVAIYLALRDDALTMETLPIRVDNDGFTRIDPSGVAMRVATGWRDMAAFEAEFVERLCR